MCLTRFILVFLLLTASFSSCERPTRFKIENDNPPKIFVYGKGIIDVIQIVGEREITSKERLAPGFPYWIIAPQKEFKLEDLEKINPIIYGKLPEGFRQVYPESGEPQPFVEGRTYGFQIMIRDSSGVNAIFVLRDGKIITEGD